jgi:3-deoxy-D-manno-octulosonate 8-phosphate phosphatase (KDO 8-P phosphatase)
MPNAEPGGGDRPPTLRDRCAAVELLVLDVDGVLTGGGIVYGTGGLELKQFHVRDGSGLKLWHQCGKQSAVLTGRRSSVVDVRAAELGVTLVVQGAGDKLAAFDGLLAAAGVAPAAACYVGDDLPDLPPLRRAGLAVAVADACAEVRAAAHYVTRAPGGGGAAREAVELILRCQGAWQRAAAAPAAGG